MIPRYVNMAEKKQNNIIAVQKEIKVIEPQLTENHKEISPSLKGRIVSLPNGWRNASLKECTSKIGSGKTPNGGDAVYVNKGILFIRSQNVYPNKLIIDNPVYITTEINKSMLGSQVKKGDVLLNITGASIGRACIYNLNIDANVNQHVCIIRNNKDIDPQFLCEFLNSEKGQNQIRSFLTKGNREGLNFQQIGSFKFPCPPVTEQKKIAEILSCWDRAIEQIEELIVAKKQLKKFLSKVLLSGKKRFKEFCTDLNKLGDNSVPEGWSQIKLEHVVEFYNGKAHEDSISDNGKYIVVNSKFVSSNGKEFKRSNKNLFPLVMNDLVMVMSDIPNGKAFAKCFLINKNDTYTLNQRICVFRTKKVVVKYLYYLLNRNKYYLEFDNGVGQTNLRKQEVLGCPLILPPLDEQKKIADVLSACDKKIKYLSNLKISYKQQKQSLMQQLLTGKVRVRVNL